MAEKEGKVVVLATHGFAFNGVLQLMRPEDPFSTALREDCPLGGSPACIENPPAPCRHHAGFRRNRQERKFWILCGCPR
ncbi:MAG TPA: hypothetical protein VI895_01565 [Bdellovibrionota bacterium]|nr:hypothetical protein [Bdellovibrionota bacterium]